MRKINLLLLLMLFSGCVLLPFDRIGPIPIKVSNIYYDKLYINNTPWEASNYEVSFLDVADVLLCFDDREFKCEDYDVPITLDFYQDAKRECFLFAKTREEILKLVKYSSVLAITKDDVLAIPWKEYEELKSSIEPHPYDPSLCKPKPSNE